MKSYELTEADAERVNARPHRSHSDVKAGEAFPAIVAHRDDITEPDSDGVPQKVGTLSHLHVFFPDHVESVKVEDRTEGEQREADRKAKREEALARQREELAKDDEDDDDEVTE